MGTAHQAFVQDQIKMVNKLNQVPESFWATYIRPKKKTKTGHKPYYHCNIPDCYQAAQRLDWASLNQHLRRHGRKKREDAPKWTCPHCMENGVTYKCSKANRSRHLYGEGKSKCQFGPHERRIRTLDLFSSDDDSDDSSGTARSDQDDKGKSLNATEEEGLEGGDTDLEPNINHVTKMKNQKKKKVSGLTKTQGMLVLDDEQKSDELYTADGMLPPEEDTPMESTESHIDPRLLGKRQSQEVPSVEEDTPMESTESHIDPGLLEVDQEQETDVGSYGADFWERSAEEFCNDG